LQEWIQPQEKYFWQDREEWRVYGKTDRRDKVECARRVLMAGQRTMEKVLLHDPMVDTSMADDDASPGGGMPYT